MQTGNSFLHTKIMSIGTALFFCEQDVLPFPAYIITALKVDEMDNIWFFISRNWNKTVSYNRTAPVNLEFYRKGYPFSITVKGKASLVNDREMMQQFMQDLLGKSVPVKEEAIAGILLVKVNIEQADFKELVARKTVHPFRNLLTGIKNWRYPGQHALQPSL
jgi:general stress protein 26